MARRILIQAGPATALAKLNDTKTADEVWNILPISGQANTWGEEIYFGIPLHIELEDGRVVVDAGELGYWPTGRAFCIFFGPTPASLGDEIRAASAVSIFGRLTGDPQEFKAVGDGQRITVERA
jgi:uncharacterized protein